MKQPQEQIKITYSPGDKLWWNYTPKDGYGYDVKIPVVFMKMTPIGRMKVSVNKKDGTWVERVIETSQVEYRYREDY